MSHRSSPTVGQVFMILAMLAAPALGDDGTIRVPIPADVARGDVLRPGRALRERLSALVEEHVGAERARTAGSVGPPVDRIVVLVDRDGEPIRPDAEAAATPRSRRATTNELRFTFDSPQRPWTGNELRILRRVLNKCYPIAKTIYGPPAFDITVNYRKADTFPLGGYYDPSINQVTIPDTTIPDTICHEMVHAFHDDDVISNQGFEEGMTHAVEIEIFNRLPGYEGGSEHHGSPVDIDYESLNRAAIGAFEGNFFLGFPGVAIRYQLASYAWAKAMIENPSFFPDFNRTFYAAAAADPSVPGSEPALVALAAAAQPSVEGIPFVDWYGRQDVLNTHPPIGTLLYQVTWGGFYLFERAPDGVETGIADVTVAWEVRDFQGTPVDAGSALTNPVGIGTYFPTPLQGHTERVSFVLDAAGPDGPVTDTMLLGGSNLFLADQTPFGVVGIVPDRDTGSVTITPLDGGSAVTVPLVHGSFSAPTLAHARGRFLAVFHGPTGETVAHQFTKDAAPYFVLLPNVTPTTSTTSTSSTSSSSTTSTSTSSTSVTSTTSTSTSTTTSTVTTTTVAPTMIRVQSFGLLDDSIPPINLAKRKISFKAKAGSGVVAPPPTSNGDPTLGGAVLTVYNAAGQPIRVRLDLPASNWRIAAGPSYVYADPHQSHGPIKSVKVTSSGVMTITGGGPTWSYPLDTPPQGLVAVRLALGTGGEWCAVLPPRTNGQPPSSARFDRQDVFKAAAGAPPPPDCPPVP